MQKTNLIKKKKKSLHKVLAEDFSRAPHRNRPEMSAGSLTPERAWRWVLSSAIRRQTSARCCHHNLANTLYSTFCLTNNHVGELRKTVFCLVCLVLKPCHPFAGLCRSVLCGVVCRLCTCNPVEVPTCNGAFVGINIYLSCSLSCCSCCALSRRFWRSSPGRQRYESDSELRFFSEKATTTKQQQQQQPRFTFS